MVLVSACETRKLGLINFINSDFRNVYLREIGVFSMSLYLKRRKIKKGKSIQQNSLDRCGRVCVWGACQRALF